MTEREVHFKATIERGRRIIACSGGIMPAEPNASAPCTTAARVVQSMLLAIGDDVSGWDSADPAQRLDEALIGVGFALGLFLDSPRRAGRTPLLKLLEEGLSLGAATMASPPVPKEAAHD